MSAAAPVAPATAPSQAIQPSNPSRPGMDGGDWYTYEVNACAKQLLNPGEQVGGFIQIDAGTDFYLQALAYQAQANGLGALTEYANIVPLVLVQMNDVASDRNFFSLPVPIGALCGDAERPSRLIRPRKFHANAQIGFTFTSLEPNGGQVYSTLIIALWGYRRFPS